MIRGEGCVHIVASGTDACDMLGTMAVRWMHAMLVTGRDAVLRSDRAAAWGLIRPTCVTAGAIPMLRLNFCP